MTTLENSYCVPSTVEEWDMLYPNANWAGQYPCEHSHVYVFGGRHKYLASWPNEDPNRTEIPVPRFLDLLHDRIVPWRVEELGGQRYGNERFYTINMPEHRCVLVHFEERVIVDARQLDKGLHIPNITTFTDLLTLIRMLTPPSNA